MKHFLLYISFASMLLFSSCGRTSQFDLTERPDATGDVLRMTDIYYIAVDHLGEIRKAAISTGLANEYDKDGRLTAQTVYDNKGNISWLTVYTYDSKGHMTGVIERQPDKADVVCSVSEEGNIRTFNKPAGVIMKHIKDGVVSEFENDKLVTEATYDERGRIILHKDLLSGDIQTFRYNEKGLSFFCIEDQDEVWDSEVRLIEFDSHGNWTKAYMYYRGKIIFVRERVITYWN